MLTEDVLHSGSLTVTLHDQYVTFETRAIKSETLNVNYSDITSIGYGFDANPLHGLFETDSITVNVLGHAYVFNSMLGTSDENKRICDAVQAKMNISRAEQKDTQIEAETQQKKQQFEKKQAHTEERIEVHINPDNPEPTIQRIELFVENKEWKKVKAYANTALDYFPTDYRFYLFLLFEELKVTSIEELKTVKEPFFDFTNYKMVRRFGNDDINKQLDDIVKPIEERNKELEKAERESRYENSYNSALELIKKENYKKAIARLQELKGYKDSEQLIDNCNRKLGEQHKTEETVLNKRREIIQGLNSIAHTIKEQIKDENKQIQDLNEQIGGTESDISKVEEEIHNLGFFGNKDRKRQLKEHLNEIECKKDVLLKEISKHKMDKKALTNKLIEADTSDVLDIEIPLLKKIGIRKNSYDDYFSIQNNTSWEIIGREGDCILFLENSIEDKLSNNFSNWPKEKAYDAKLLSFPKKVRNAMAIAKNIFADSKDKPGLPLFLLSKTEVKSYLPDEEERIWAGYSGDAFEWSLRNQVEGGRVSIIDKNGCIDTVDCDLLASHNIYPRIAMWIDLSKCIF